MLLIAIKDTPFQNAIEQNILPLFHDESACYCSRHAVFSTWDGRHVVVVLYFLPNQVSYFDLCTDLFKHK